MRTCRLVMDAANNASRKLGAANLPRSGGRVRTGASDVARTRRG
jgi:hypothetical protein